MPGVPLLAGFVGLLCVTAPTLLPGQAASTGAEVGRYEYRYGVPTGTSVGVLSDEPEVLEFGIAEDPQFSEAGVVSVIEYHGVYPLSVEELRSAITAYEEYTVISRRVVASEGRPAPEEPPYEPIATVVERQAALMRTSFKFLFFGRDYDYVLSSMTEELPGDAILVRSAMTESLAARHRRHRRLRRRGHVPDLPAVLRPGRLCRGAERPSTCPRALRAKRRGTTSGVSLPLRPYRTLKPGPARVSGSRPRRTRFHSEPGRRHGARRAL